MTATIDGPAWAQQGLVQRDGRYPLAVEAPVLSMVATLVPGISTLSQFARYYALYWALAGLAAERDFTVDECRRTLRRAELLLALVSQAFDGRENQAHGVAAVARGRGAEGDVWTLAEVGPGSYSPRSWGFWSQYGGPSDALGTVKVEDGVLRPGRHPCPPAVREMYAPLLAVAAGERDPAVDEDLLIALGHLALGERTGADLAALRELFTATRSERHDPAAWKGEDLTRRAIFRIVARSAVLVPDAAGRLDALRRAVAYGPAALEDPILVAEERTAAWRGVLLRHRSVGAWRRLWADLVAHVREEGIVTRSGLHDWVSDRLPDQDVRGFAADLPDVTDTAGHPAPAEDLLPEGLGRVGSDIAVLMIGARRRDTLAGIAQVAFLGGRRGGRGTFLDPAWVQRRVAEHADQPIRALGRTLIDDMLAQAQRVALRKVEVRDGRMRLFTRLHERNGTYTARSGEGEGNVGVRVDQLAGIAEQLGLLRPLGAGTVTRLGSTVLAVPA